MAKGTYHPFFSIIRYLYAGCALLFFVGCGEDGDTPDYAQLSMMEFIRQDPNFTIFADALELTGLNETLDAEAPFTLLLPSDQALEDAGISSVDELSAEEWERKLNYHITQGSLNSDVLLGSVQESLLPGYYWLINEADGALEINGATKMLSGDLFLKNGVIHILTGFLEPQALNVTFMAQNKGFNTFVKGLFQTEMDQVIEDREGTFTIFAPTDEAFSSYFQANGITEEDWLAFSRLDEFMQYFILDKTLDSTQLITEALIPLSGDTLYINNQEGEIWLNGNASLQEKNIQGGNGLIHGLDQVITAPSNRLRRLFPKTRKEMAMPNLRQR
ncbi:hypothetical protein DN752_12120 [Echinicola strongylocentroti]|uniref:FAS1 domain-containing protein n=1 Tax=Echinicola strongylocentroti TaxID=1795355 RepID=A0A2Z4IJ87_9BACT|nr:fasciclin domain-containing protein [Echinicola strongylocentroti]AWW30809.1 hypothetical protein DN752_12120 [Echinicola strongylocentroti]